MDLLKNWLRDTGTSQAKLAAQAGVNAANISQYLSRRTIPTLPVFRRLVKITGLDCCALMESFLEGRA